MDFPADLDVEALLEPHRTKWGKDEVIAVMTVCGPAVFRCPTGVEYTRFRSAAEKEGAHTAQKMLLLLTVVAPDRTAFGALLDKKPGIIPTCIDEVLTLAGVDPKAAVAK